MRHLLLLLALAGCTQPPETVTMSPQLTCPAAVRCTILGWSIGFKVGLAQIGGTHLYCRCVESETS